MIKRKRLQLGCFVGMLLLATVMLSGCQKYDTIDLPAVETAAADITQEAKPETESPVSSSAVKTEVTTNTAPEMKVVDETVYVTGDNVNLRSNKSPASQSLGLMKKGDTLRRVGYDDSWSKVIYNEKECYISTQYVSLTKPEPETTAAAETATAEKDTIFLNQEWKYAGFAKINTGAAVLYRSTAENRKGKVVCVNAGHGTKGGSSVKTQCHPDGTPKVTGGTTASGATTAVAVSSGMEFSDGTAEAVVTLKMAMILKDKLLANGYDVLMIRETDDVQLDNIARTVIANNRADCHIALHWDSTTSDKGAFYMSVPNVASYRAMEPVASKWKEHHALGDSLIAGLKDAGVKIFSNGTLEMDLTQTSFSTIPSIDIELGDKGSDHSNATLEKLAAGLVSGVDRFFGN